MQVNYSPAQILEYLRAIYPADTALTIEPYAYTLSFSALAAGGSASASLQINGNADFLLLGYAHRAANAGAAQTVSTMVAPCARMLIVDNGTGRQFSSAALDLQTFSENGDIGKTLPFPRLIAGKSSLAFTLTSYAAAETPTLDFVMLGVNVYTMSR